jgi:hypothetical protein
MRPILLAAVLALSGCAALGPVGQSKADAVKADIARIEAEVGPQIPGIETLIAQIGASDYIGAAATLVTVAPAIYSAGGPAVADARALIADLRALLSAASAGKSVQPFLDLARAEAILSGGKPAESVGKTFRSAPGPAPAQVPSVVTFEGKSGTWTETRFEHAVLVERVR